MKAFALRLLKSALPAVVLAALFGYALAYGSAIYIQVNAPIRPQLEAGSESSAERPLPGDDIGTVLKTRLPIVLACWTFAIIFFFEALVALRKGLIQPTIPKPAKPTRQHLGPNGMDPEVEALFNQLLAQSEREETKADAAA